MSIRSRSGSDTPPARAALPLLRGQVFPHESGATALMLVTGDPLRVWSDLVEQAAQAGFG
ncbi:MAG TPA: hypothetical protein VFY84_02195 [Jiangellales bacterium]|nr:hypothetical protein [Jiangellales bacterium]